MMMRGSVPARRVAILFNPISGKGSGRARATAVREELARRGHAVDLVTTQSGPPSTWLPPILAGRDAAVIVGGDGAMRSASGVAASTGVPLYHCRAGTENLFARSLGAGGDRSAVADAIDRLDIRRFDLGRFSASGGHDEPFLIMASVGFDADVVHALSASRRGAISHMSYLAPILRSVVRWRPSVVRLAVDDAPMRELGRGVLVVANFPAYAFRLDPARGARPDDGLLDAAFLPCNGGAGAARWALRLLLRRGEVQGVHRERGRRFHVRVDRTVAWQLDGDPAVRSDLELDEARMTVVPGAVPIVMPVATR